MSDHYTIRCEVRLRPEFVPVVQNLYSPSAKKFKSSELWHWVASEHREFEFIGKFALTRNSELIPFGPISMAPDGWAEEEQGLFEDIWRFCCTTPDYGSMQVFFEHVLSKMLAQVVRCQVVKNKYEVVPPKIISEGNKSSLAIDIALTELASCGEYHPTAAFHALWQHAKKHRRDWDDEALYVLDQIRSYDQMVKSPESFMRICEQAFGDVAGIGVPDSLKEILIEELAKAPIYDRS